MSMTMTEPGRTSQTDLATEAWPRAIANDLAYLKTVLVNVFFFRDAGRRGSRLGSH